MTKKRNNKKKNNDFVDFEVSKFVPFLRPLDAFSLNYGCGCSTLSLLTGKAPFEIFLEIKRKDVFKDFPDSLMLRYLRKHNFEIKKINLKSLPNKCNSLINKINRRHVILVSQHLYKNMASWLVYYDMWQFHNFDVLETRKLEFLNHPIMSCYLIKTAIYSK